MVGESVPEALIKSLRETIVPSLKPIIPQHTLEDHLHTIIQTSEEVVSSIFCLIFFDNLAVTSPIKLKGKEGF